MAKGDAPIDLDQLRHELERDLKSSMRLRRQIMRLKRRQVAEALKAISQGKAPKKYPAIPYERTIFKEVERLTDRVMGKPAQTVDVKGKISHEHELSHRLEAWREYEREAAAEGQDDDSGE